MTRFNLGDVDLSKDEQAQFDEMLKGDRAPPPAVEPEPAEPLDEAAKALSKEPPPASDGPDEDDPGVVMVDDNGRIRDSRGKFVPHGAFHSERTRRKAAETERETLRQDLAKERAEAARMSERLNLMMQAYGIEDKGTAPAAPADGRQRSAPAAKEPVKPIPVEQDPFAAFKQLQEHVFSAKQATTPEIERVQQEVQQLRQAQAQAAVGQKFAQDVGEARKSDPDFDDAFNHIIDMRARELKFQFPQATDAQINGQVRQEVQHTILREYQEGRNPTAMVKGLASVRGFTAKARAPANGTPPAAADPVAEKIERINQGQRAAASLSGIAGQSGDVADTARQLATLGEEEYMERAGKMSRRDFERRYLGRE